MSVILFGKHENLAQKDMFILVAKHYVILTRSDTSSYLVGCYISHYENWRA